MTKDELIKLLENVPGNAVIYSCSDHGQEPEQSGTIQFSDHNHTTMPYSDDDDDVFMHSDDRGYSVAQVDATAVLIW